MAIKVKSTKQKVLLPAEPLALYKALLSSKEHSAMIGAKVKASARLGGKTSAHDGYIEAKNLALTAGKKIVQAWRGSDWAKGHWSKVRFDFKAAKGGSLLTLTHTGIPADEFKGVKDGWPEYYWKPMKRYFGKLVKKAKKAP